MLEPQSPREGTRALDVPHRNDIAVPHSSAGDRWCRMEVQHGAKAPAAVSLVLARMRPPAAEKAPAARQLPTSKRPPAGNELPINKNSMAVGPSTTVLGASEQ